MTSFEKTMLDADLCGKLMRFFEGIDLSENAQAMSAIAATGPGQHFLGSDHTQANFLTALFRPETPDNTSYEQWTDAGQLDASQRANALWKAHLEAYDDPGLDPSVDEELQAYMAKTKEEIGEAAYF
ncbi:trimethylamine methyltransferase family protein [Roseovarius sp. W115]|uniref:Trimethylamine methyltransferase family protein n=1 Tax=Roseovarius rhodophyticola TaxID=3080827 RepID=A0ABZ2TIG9_9RHOB|nr:trimethylamine methyltransferase family protein [Roseovarius sp. W115]MDV2929780.1 trimethylamine methyltransferase family protein [Roseovarius sp. W115]